jgi:hypothetical protein
VSDNWCFGGLYEAHVFAFTLSPIGKNPIIVSYGSPVFIGNPVSVFVWVTVISPSS